MNSKSQVKFGETFAIIIIVYIVIMIGLIWYNNSNTSALRDLREEDLNERSFERFSYFETLDLVHKSTLGIVDTNFDYHSLKVFSEYTQTSNGRAHIQQELGFALIELDLMDSQVLFEQGEIDLLEEITLYNNTQQRETSRIDSFVTLIPVEHSDEEKTLMGKLNVRLYYYE